MVTPASPPHEINPVGTPKQTPTVYYGLGTPTPPSTSPNYEPTRDISPSSGLPSPDVKRRKEHTPVHDDQGSFRTHEDVSYHRPTMLARSVPAMTPPDTSPASISPTVHYSPLRRMGLQEEFSAQSSPSRLVEEVPTLMTQPTGVSIAERPTLQEQAVEVRPGVVVQSRPVRTPPSSGHTLPIADENAVSISIQEFQEFQRLRMIISEESRHGHAEAEIARRAMAQEAAECQQIQQMSMAEKMAIRTHTGQEAHEVQVQLREMQQQLEREHQLVVTNALQVQQEGFQREEKLIAQRHQELMEAQYTNAHRRGKLEIENTSNQRHQEQLMTYENALRLQQEEYIKQLAHERKEHMEQIQSTCRSNVVSQEAIRQYETAAMNPLQAQLASERRHYEETILETHRAANARYAEMTSAREAQTHQIMELEKQLQAQKALQATLAAKAAEYKAAIKNEVEKQSTSS